MKIHHQELLDVILEVIKAKYSEDISIMIIYGSCINGTSNEKSDLDMIFVPKTEKGWKLAKTFILKDCGIDLWGTTWDKLESFSNYDDMKVSVIADSQLVYYVSEEDKQRYESLKKCSHDIENGELTPVLIHKAETHFKKATHYFGRLCLEDDLTCAGGILYEISDVICLLNHTFLHFGIKRMIEEISEFKRLPVGFIAAFSAVAKIDTIEQAKTTCHTLINIVADFLKQVRKEIVSPVPFSEFAGLYEEISNHWNKIYYNCEKDNAVVALLAAASLQNELNNVQNKLGISIEDLQFIESFNAKKLRELALAAKKAQHTFVELLKSSGIPIVQFNSVSQVKSLLME